MKLQVNSDTFISDIGPGDKPGYIEHLKEKQIYEQTLSIPFPYTQVDADWWINHVAEIAKQQGRSVNWAIRCVDGMTTYGVEAGPSGPILLPIRKAAVLWTGGKDCTLALYRAKEMGVSISCLATFIAPDKVFRAHPLDKMKAQSKALGIPIHFLAVNKPYREGYIRQLAVLKDEFGVDAVVTGDIDFVEGHPNWIAECCSELGMMALFPLWQESRLSLIKELISRNIEAQISWINHAAIPVEWLGRRIDDALLVDLIELNKRAGIDPCGENGEYHTMVLGFPPL